MTSRRGLVLLLCAMPCVAACRDTPKARAAELQKIAATRKQALAVRMAALSANDAEPVAMWIMPPLLREISGLALTSRFIGIIGGDSLPVRKPDPAGLDALRGLTGTARERTLLVGDSSIDVATARAGGVAFCGVAWGLSPDALFAAAPERVVHDAAELLTFIES